MAKNFSMSDKLIQLKDLQNNQIKSLQLSTFIHFSLDDVKVSVEERAGAILALDEALEKFARTNGQQTEIVEMKFFGGLSNKEVAKALDVSERTIVRKWRAARLWLFRELKQN